MDAPIPYGRQDVTADDIAAVDAVLRSDWLTQGPAVPAFEQALATACGAPHAVAVNSATSALHLAYLALGLGPGDLLWTSPNTFVATANAARMCGADVGFVDVDPRSYNLDPVALADALTRAEQRGRLPKIITAVHFAGQSCDMAAIAALARRYGARVVEDASHAVGARHRDAAVGACIHSDVTVFSFHPVKIITTAEGGMALTRDAALAERMRLLRSHGITRDAQRIEAADPGAWYYEQHELGFNYRMTDLQAALGRSQLARLDAYVERRHAIARRYDEALRGSALLLPWRDPQDRSALHLYPVQVLAPRGRRAVFDSMRAAGIGVNVHYIPVHLQPDYRRFGCAAGDFPQAEAYYARAMSLPMFPTLDDDAQQRVVDTLLTALQ